MTLICFGTEQRLHKKVILHIKNISPNKIHCIFQFEFTAKMTHIYRGRLFHKKRLLPSELGIVPTLIQGNFF